MQYTYKYASRVCSLLVCTPHSYVLPGTYVLRMNFLFTHSTCLMLAQGMLLRIVLMSYARTAAP